MFNQNGLMGPIPPGMAHTTAPGMGVGGNNANGGNPDDSRN